MNPQPSFLTSMSVRDFSVIDLRGDVTNFLEARMDNDANGNPIYVGYSKFPNADTAAPVWFIIKITYDANQSPTHQELPVNGIQFNYIWDNRATYF